MSYPYQKGNKVFEPLVALAIAIFGKEAIELREILSALPTRSSAGSNAFPVEVACNIG